MTDLAPTTVHLDRPALMAAVAEHAEAVCDLAAAPRSEWLQLRRAGLGGSDASAVARLNRYASPSSVYMAKIVGEDQIDNEAMEWGRRLEDVVADKFSEVTGLELFDPRLMFRSRAWPFLQATPDRLTADGGLLEMKTTSRWLADAWQVGDDGLVATVPDYALLQAIHYGLVLGVRRLWFAVLIDGRDFRIGFVDLDQYQPAADALLAIEQAFWTDHVQAQVPPPADASEATTRALAALYAAADIDTETALDYVDGIPAGRALDQLTALQQTVKLTKVEIGGLKNHLRAELGTHEVGLVDGIAAVTWREGDQTDFDVKAFRADWPALAEAYTNRSRRRTLRVTAAWKNRNAA